MHVHAALLSKPAQRWLVAGVIAALFVLMGASGDDIFARHVGMSVSASAASSEGADVVRSTGSSGTKPSVRHRPGDGSGHGTGDHDGAVHTLHLLGACLAILCAGAVFPHRVGRWCRSSRATAMPSPRSVCPASWLAGVRRGPPPLVPPRSSPVIRT